MVDIGNTPGPSDLRKWKQGLLDKAEELKTEIRLRQVELGQVEERISLVSKLIAVDSTDGPSSNSIIEPGDVTGPNSTADSPRIAGDLDLEDAVEELLREFGKPMHIAVIREQLNTKGVQIPGRGDEANIIVRIRKVPERFTRTARGTYALPEWGIPEMTTKTTRARRSAKR